MKASQADRSASRGMCRVIATVAVMALVVVGWGVMSAVSPPRGSDAPAIKLKDLDGGEVSSAKLAPRSLLLIFGEFTNDNCKQACAEALDVLADPRLASGSVAPILIVAQDVPAAKLKEESAKGRFPALILHDPKREAFGAYRVLVVPTVVVVNPKGKVVHSSPGFTPRFKELLLEALLVATGKETDEQFAQSMDPKSAASPEVVRADRFTHLGIELTRHGLFDMAESRFTEALKIAPGHAAAKLGLGELMLKQDRVADAEPLFNSVLAGDPDSIDAALGIAAVQVKRGGDDLAKAEASLRAIISKHAGMARAHYLLGMVHEKRNNATGAAGEYRLAAELLMDR